MAGFFKRVRFSMAAVVIAGAAIGVCPQTAGIVPQAVIASPATAPVAPPFAGVSLKIGNETVAPGGIAQVKLFVTEPQPISTAGGRLRLGGFSSFDGIAVMSQAGDTMGVAVVKGSEVSISIVSPTATFGLNPDYPILTVAGRVPLNTPLGLEFPLDIDVASLAFTDAAGIAYPIHAKSGGLRIAPIVGVDDVFPGSSLVAAGDTITIVGRGFQPTTRVRFKETLLSSVEFFDSSRMRATLAQPARMHGMGIKVTNRDGTEDSYFSYQRTTRQGTTVHAALRSTMPIFADSRVTSAVVVADGASTGLALQNLNANPVTALAELLDAGGSVRASAAITVQANRFVVQELTELFGVAYSPNQQIRVRSSAPFQVMGIAIDAAGGARPIVPR
jgi:IPT/TIG domain-containing protein